MGVLGLIVVLACFGKVVRGLKRMFLGQRKPEKCVEGCSGLGILKVLQKGAVGIGSY